MNALNSVTDSLFAVWNPLPTCPAFQELNAAAPSGQSETAGDKSGEILSSDPLATLLDAAQSPGDKNTSDSKYDAVEFLKLFRAKATTPECKELSIEDGVKVMYLLEQCLANFELDQGELDDMACGMLKLMGDPNWNNNNSAELICQTRTIQGNAAKIKRPVLTDVRYGTRLPLTWGDADTVRLLSASEFYLRYYSQFLEELSAKKVSAFMLPYLKSMLRLKMIAENDLPGVPVFYGT